eukprot:752071-Hanusia_phi.AAC.3
MQRLEAEAADAPAVPPNALPQGPQVVEFQLVGGEAQVRQAGQMLESLSQRLDGRLVEAVVIQLDSLQQRGGLSP